jgi:hypothetical protein
MNQKQASEVPNPGNDLTYIARRLLRAVVMKTEGAGQFLQLGMPDTSYRFTLNRMNLNNSLSNTSWSGALLLGQNQIYRCETGLLGPLRHAAGGNVTYTTKPGSNELHGNARLWFEMKPSHVSLHYAGSCGRVDTVQLERACRLT